MEILVPKKTGTYADALCAIGYASLLSELRGTSARIHDRGEAYLVSCPAGTELAEWKAPTPGFLYVHRKTKEERPPAHNEIMDYEHEQELAEAAKKSAASARAKRKVEEALEEVEDAPVAGNHPEYRFAAILESMRKGWSSDKSLYRWIADNPQPCLNMVKERLQGKSAEFPAEWSNSQILNPSTGKGVHASKTIAKSAGGFNLTDTFDEWMKVRGLWLSMLGFRSGDDFKFYVIDPGDISSQHLALLRNNLRDLGLWGIVRLDIEAVLRLLQRLMILTADGIIPVSRRTPRQIIRGLQLSFFKSLGTAAALMNDSFLPLPDWFVIENQDDIDAYLLICQEPYGTGKGKGDYGPLSLLKENRSDDVELLQKYRRWLTSGILGDLLEFHSSYASWLLRKLASNEFALAFRESILHRLLIKGYPEVKDIIESPGFKSIAQAIRNSTVKAVWEKQQKRPQPREIHFGFSQKLKQRIKGGAPEFISAISEFIQKHNWEVANLYGGKRHSVSDKDIDQLVLLTNDHGAELVGMLLLAYGFSRSEAAANKDEAETPESASV